MKVAIVSNEAPKSFEKAVNAKVDELVSSDHIVLDITLASSQSGNYGTQYTAMIKYDNNELFEHMKEMSHDLNADMNAYFDCIEEVEEYGMMAVYPDGLAVGIAEAEVFDYEDIDSVSKAAMHIFSSSVNLGIKDGYNYYVCPDINTVYKVAVDVKSIEEVSDQESGEVQAF